MKLLTITRVYLGRVLSMRVFKGGRRGDPPPKAGPEVSNPQVFDASTTINLNNLSSTK